MSDLMSVDDFKQALPKRVRGNLNQQVIDKINAVLNEPEMYETYRENLLSYTNVMQDGKFKLSNYVDAVKYCSHRLMGKTQIDAFSITFPEKIKRWTAQGVSKKDISSYVTAYNKSKLVTKITEQSAIPVWLVNQDNYQKAINTQVELMLGARSEKVRSDAANSLLTHLKPPETHKVELDVGVKEDSAIAALRDTTARLIEQQKQMLKAGMTNTADLGAQGITIEHSADE